MKDKHRQINHGNRIYVEGQIHTNTVENAFSLLKHGIMGTRHRISAKHLASHPQEMEFRFNRRNRHDLFIDTIRHMVTPPTLTFEKIDGLKVIE
jgi:ISXO2-like transposase domain